MPGYSGKDYFKIEAEVWFPQQILAKSHFFAEMRLDRLQALATFIQDRPEFQGDSEPTMEMYEEVVKDFLEEQPPQEEYVLVEYISTPEEEKFMVSGEVYATTSLSEYITVEIADMAVEGLDMPQGLITAIMKREQGPYEMLVKELYVYEYGENGEFQNRQSVPLTEQSFQDEYFEVYEAVGGSVAAARDILSLKISAPLSYTCDDQDNRVIPVQMTANSKTFFRCEPNMISPVTESLDEPPNFRRVEYQWYIHEIDESGEKIADIEDEIILLTWKNFNTVFNENLIIGSESTFALEEDRIYKVHFYFLGYTVNEVYLGEEELIIRQEGRRADLGPFTNELQIYHSDDFWFYPDVLVVKGCSEEGQPIYEQSEVDWDADSESHITCELYKSGERNMGSLTKSQFGSCVVTRDNLDPDTTYELDISVKFDEQPTFEQKQTILLKTADIAPICKIQGVQAYSLESGEQLEYTVAFQNILDEKLEDYEIEWSCYTGDGLEGYVEDCFETSDYNTRAVLKNPEQFKRNARVSIYVNVVHKNSDDILTLPCFTRLFVLKPGIKVLQTNFFLVGAGNDFTTDYTAYVTPFDHIFMYCQHEVPDEEGITIDYDWYELDLPRESLTSTYKSHKSYSREQMQEFPDDFFLGVRCEAKGEDADDNLLYFGATEVYLRYNDFAPEAEIEYEVSPQTGIAWETDFQVKLQVPGEYVYDCQFYYEFDRIRYEMIPQGMTPAESDQVRSYQSYTNMPILIDGIKLPADLRYNDRKLRTFASCFIPGQGQWVSKYDILVEPRSVGTNPTKDAEIAEHIADTQVSGEFEEVTHYYLRRKDNYDVMNEEQKVMTLQKLLIALGDVPKNDPEIMDITKNMELYNIAIALKDEYFQLKTEMSEDQQKQTIKIIGESFTKMLKFNPVKFGNGRRFIPIDDDKGVEMMRILEDVMKELGIDQRDEIISSFEEVLISMHVSLDPTEEADLYDFDLFQAYYIKARPEFLKTFDQRTTYSYTDPITLRNVKISYTPADIINNSQMNQVSESVYVIHKVYFPGRSSLLSPVVKVMIYRQPTQNLDQARHYVDIPSDLTLFVEIQTEFSPQDTEEFSTKSYGTRCAMRENVDESWRELRPLDYCIDGEVQENLFRCCTETPADFGVQLYRKTSSGGGSGSKKDSFSARLAIGPLFLVLFDIYLAAALFLILIVWKTKDSFQLEFTGLYPNQQQKNEIKQQLPANNQGRQASSALKTGERSQQSSGNKASSDKKLKKAKELEERDNLEGIVQYDGGDSEQEDEEKKKEKRQKEEYGQEVSEPEGDNEESYEYVDEDQDALEHSPPKTSAVQKMDSNIMEKENHREVIQPYQESGIEEISPEQQEKQAFSSQKKVRAAEEDDGDFHNLQGLVNEGEEEEKYDIVASSPEANVSGKKRRHDMSSHKQEPHNDSSMNAHATGPAQFMQNEGTAAPNLALSPQKKNPLVGSSGAQAKVQESQVQGFIAGQALSTKETFILSQKCFNRFIAGFFERKRTYNKLGLTFVCLSQYFLLILLSIMVWYTELFIVVFILMRVAQVLIQFLMPPIKGNEQHILPKTRTFSFIGLGIGIVIIILTHIVVGLVDAMMKEDEEMGSWGLLFIVCFFLELLWDVTLVHLIAMHLINKGKSKHGLKQRMKMPEMFFRGIPMQELEQNQERLPSEAQKPALSQKDKRQAVQKGKK